MNTETPVRETVPAGCLPAPGYILEVAENGPWFRQDGLITDVWSERGVWPSISEAGIALHHFLQRQGAAENLEGRKAGGATP